jgi:hypothetical protein
LTTGYGQSCDKTKIKSQFRPMPDCCVTVGDIIMATRMGCFQSDDRIDERSGQDLNNSPNDCGFASGWDLPSMAVDLDMVPDDSLPLFLASDPAPEAAWERKPPVRAPRILKAAILAASAIAVAFGLSMREDKLAVVEDASAALIAAVPVHSATVGRSPSSNIQNAGAAQAPPATTTATPTRAAIAAAFQTAQQGQTEIRQPPPAAPPARRLDADELVTLLNRAKSLIATGDIASARLLLERAADAREASAALILARTFDPAVLGTPDARSIAPDPAAARIWYQKAAQFGSQDAQRRLDQIQN